MRRFQALHRSFPFLTRFRLYRVSADPRPVQTLRWPVTRPCPRRLRAGEPQLPSPRVALRAPVRPRAQLLAAPAVFLAQCRGL